MHDVVVIGAGVTGLSAAYELLKRGRDVLLLERDTKVGGKAVSERFDGFLMEHGPTTLNASVPEAEEMTQELGLATSRLDLGAGVRKRYLRDGNRLAGISTHPAGFLLSGYLPLSGRLAMLAEVARRRRRQTGEESVDAFVRRRFGAAFADKVMDPMIGGIFMGDSRELAVESVFPKLVALERQHGSVIRGAIRSRKNGDPGRRLFSWPGGLATLPRGLRARLGKTVRTGIAVKRLVRKAGGFAVETSAGPVLARAVILAVQPHVAAALLEKLEPVTAEAAAAIPAPPSAVVFLGYRRRDVGHPLDGLGYLATRGSGVISGVQFCSTMFAGRAPAGHVSIAAYVGGAREPELAKIRSDKLIQEVAADLGGILGISAKPVVSRVRHWPLGLPQYTLGHNARRQVIEAANLRLDNLFLAGNFLGGVSVGNCLQSGQDVAARVDASLGNSAQNRARPQVRGEPVRRL